MKKFITIAALLAAGTAFSNALTTTVTFSGTQTSDGVGSDWTVNGTDGGYVTSTLDTQELFSGFTWGNLSITNSEGAVSTPQILTQGDRPLSTSGCVIPYSNPVKYDLTFSLTAGDSELSISSLTFEMVLCRNGGSFTNTATNSDTWAGTISLSSGGSSLGTTTLLSANANVLSFTPFSDSTLGATPNENFITIALADTLTVSAGSQISFTLAVQKDTGTPNAGLRSISVTASPVPEPSAFGLLAGIGALALVAARRRRK